MKSTTLQPLAQKCAAEPFLGGAHTKGQVGRWSFVVVLIMYKHASMPGSKHYIAEAYLMGVVRRFDEVPASIWRLSDRRSELWVSMSVTLAVRSMAMILKEQWLTQKACYHACNAMQMVHGHLNAQFGSHWWRQLSLSWL